MRSYQIFASLPPERNEALLRTLSEKVPIIFAQALGAACVALKARPVYLKRQPFEKRAEAIRRALARVIAAPVAAEVLAAYLLECRKELLVEWLDLVGLEHSEGVLENDAPPPPTDAKLRKATEKFLAAEEDPDRRLLLRAFAAQEVITWPALDALLAPSPAQP
jgi:hypothetical protein